MSAQLNPERVCNYRCICPKRVLSLRSVSDIKRFCLLLVCSAAFRFHCSKRMSLMQVFFPAVGIFSPPAAEFAIVVDVAEHSDRSSNSLDPAGGKIRWKPLAALRVGWVDGSTTPSTLRRLSVHPRPAPSRSLYQAHIYHLGAILLSLHSCSPRFEQVSKQLPLSDSHHGVSYPSVCCI